MAASDLGNLILNTMGHTEHPCSDNSQSMDIQMGTRHLKMLCVSLQILRVWLLKASCVSCLTSQRDKRG